jgi:hypothetical protein
MAAGISKTLWSVIDPAGIIDATLTKLGKRGPYKKSPEENSNWDTTKFALS